MPTPNTNGAGTKQTSDQNSDGATLGQTASDKAGLHGAKTIQHTTNPSGTTAEPGGGGASINTLYDGGISTSTGGYYGIQAILRALKDAGIMDPNGGSDGQF